MQIEERKDEPLPLDLLSWADLEDLIEEGIDDAHDMDVTTKDYARSVVHRLRKFQETGL